MTDAARRVLVVDDDPDVRAATRSLLEVGGFEVASVDHGADALEVLASSAIDIVLSDLRMPALGGVEMLREIRRRWPELPVVLMTAFTLDPGHDPALTEGAFTLLTRRSRLTAAVGALLRAIARPIVLVVDACELDVDAVTAFLEGQGLRAAASDDPAAAITSAGEGRVDVVVTDLRPFQGGAALIERMRRQSAVVVTVAVSGHSVAEMMRRVADAGSVLALRRPLSPSELLAAISEVRALPRERKGA